MGRKYINKQGRRKSRGHSGVLNAAYKRQQLFKKQDGICALCREEIDLKLKWPHQLSATLDCIIPYSKGGGVVDSNLQLTHYKCNHQRGNKMINEMNEITEIREEER